MPMFDNRAESATSEPKPDCPRCAEPMVQREGPRGMFYGCSNFPVCRGSRNADGSTTRYAMSRQSSITWQGDSIGWESDPYAFGSMAGEEQW